MPLKFIQKAAKQQSITWLTAVCVFIMLCVLSLIIRTKRDTDASILWVDHTYQVMKTLDHIQLDLSLPTTHIPGELDEQLKKFQTLIGDNPRQIGRLLKLRLHIAQADQVAAQDLLGEMMNEETTLLHQRQQALNHTRKVSRTVLYSSLAAAFLAMIFLLYKIKKDGDRRRAAEQRLFTSESKYRNLIDNVSAVIYSTDMEGYIEYASPGALSLTGYSVDELKGKRYTMLVDPGFLSTIKKHYEQQFREGVRETTLQFRTITRSGEYKWVEQIAILLIKDGRPSGFQCFVRDITANKKLQEELEAYELKLKENQVLLQSILDNTASIIYVKNLEGKYKIVNRRFLEVLQLKEEQVINHTDYDFCDSSKADEYHSMDKIVIQTGRSIEIEEQLVTAAGPLHLLLIKFPLRDDDNNIVGISGIATDMTERVHSHQQLIAAKTESEDARKMQEQFLANMSHEIRTPMNGIQGMTNLLLETKLTPQQKEFAAIISRSVDNLLVIINDILDLSRIKAGKLTIEKIDFRLQDVVSNVQSLFRHRINKKGLRFDLDIDSAIPEWLQGDPHRLNQVLINLVGNAVKFTEKGVITLKVVPKEQQDPNQLTLVFSVTDTGVGIPEKSLPHLFESFSQAGLDISRRYGGTGLGLAICHQLLSLQGGDISVVSTEGKGTTFTFTLSFGCEEVANITRQITHSLQDFAGFLTGRHFLVVEDNPINQKLMDYVLRKTGAAVTLADNGEQAIHQLKANEFDLIVMDLQMPGMDGYETTKYIRSNLRLRTPIMAMTANAINGEQIRCLEAGMNDYMSKPFEFKDFYTHIAELLRNPSATPTPHDPSKDTANPYSLSLLEEVGDDEYLQDILHTFLANLPGQLAELQSACTEKDHDRVFFISHKLKGSCGMLQAVTLIEKLSMIQKLSKEKIDATEVVEEISGLFKELLHRLEKENLRFSGISNEHNK
ncbi:MAG: PAS domain S-box protein [Chitinophagaceae bacterium]|nr:PAS domain S-box protein [Chitinophagaceae bacterium]